MYRYAILSLNMYFQMEIGIIFESQKGLTLRNDTKLIDRISHICSDAMFSRVIVTDSGIYNLLYVSILWYRISDCLYFMV